MRNWSTWDTKSSQHSIPDVILNHWNSRWTLWSQAEQYLMVLRFGDICILWHYRRRCCCWRSKCLILVRRDGTPSVMRIHYVLKDSFRVTLNGESCPMSRFQYKLAENLKTFGMLISKLYHQTDITQIIKEGMLFSKEDIVHTVFWSWEFSFPIVWSLVTFLMSNLD